MQKRLKSINKHMRGKLKPRASESLSFKMAKEEKTGKTYSFVVKRKDLKK